MPGVCRLAHRSNPPVNDTKYSEKLAPVPFDDEQADLILQFSDKVHS